MTKFKIAAATLAALTLATAFGGQAQAHPRWGWGVGAGFAAGAIIGAAAASNSSYYYGYRDCHWVQRVDDWGNVRTYKVCNYYRFFSPLRSASPPVHPRRSERPARSVPARAGRFSPCRLRIS